MTSNQKINWAIVGLGRIARIFASDLIKVPQANLYAVASRSFEKAIHFSKAFDVNHHFTQYEEMLQDPNIDIVYISSPHVLHFEQSLLALQHGKAVLCEKPITMDVNQLEILIDLAKKKNLFLMEGLWTRFLPSFEYILDKLSSPGIGKINLLKSDFCFKATYNPADRLFDKKLGGGSLMDVGIYPIFMSILFLGIPVKVSASSIMLPTGVDASCTISFEYSDGSQAILESSIVYDTPTEMMLIGSDGRLVLNGPFYKSEKVTSYIDYQLEEKIFPLEGNGFLYEINEVHQCLEQQLMESQKLPLSLSLIAQNLMQEIRTQINLSY